MLPFRFLRSHAPGVGQDKKERLFSGKSFCQRFLFPVGVNRHIVYCLHTGGIIVQDYDFMSVLPAFFFQYIHMSRTNRPM